MPENFRSFHRFLCIPECKIYLGLFSVNFERKMPRYTGRADPGKTPNQQGNGARGGAIGQDDGGNLHKVLSLVVRLSLASVTGKVVFRQKRKCVMLQTQAHFSWQPTNEKGSPLRRPKKTSLTKLHLKNVDLLDVWKEMSQL